MRLIAILAILTLSIAVLAVDKVQSLHIKSGLWQVTTTRPTNSDLPIPDGLLEKLTPEQRERLEKRMKAQSSAPEKTTVTDQCVTAEHLKKGVPFGPIQTSCSRVGSTSTAGLLEMQMKCTDHNVTSEGVLRIEVVDSKKVKGAWRLHEPGSRLKESVAFFTAKWMKATCTDKR